MKRLYLLLVKYYTGTYTSRDHTLPVSPNTVNFLNLSFYAQSVLSHHRPQKITSKTAVKQITNHRPVGSQNVESAVGIVPGYAEAFRVVA